MAIETVSQHTGQKYTEQQYRCILESIAVRTATLRDLIGTDGDTEKGVRSGSFQNSSEVSSLLFNLGETLQSQVEALCIASNAGAILNERKLKKGAGHGN